MFEEVPTLLVGVEGADVTDGSAEGVDSAHERGLHTCPQAAFSRYQHVVRREFGIPDDQVVMCGYADPDAVPNNLITERALLEDFVRWYTE